MTRMPAAWDYLILTASNDRQAQAYESLLALRQQTGRLARVRQSLVVADLEGRRIGSGGSTLECLRVVLNREAAARGLDLAAPEAPLEILRALRILIVHAGGDSRRLPAYGPCGKIFLPVPGESDGALGETLFDRLAPIFLNLEAALPGEGQVVVTSGDALILIDSAAIRFSGRGLIAVGCESAPEEAARHGVLCPGEGDEIRLYLQKPSASEQARLGALNRYGKALLDAGVMSFDASACAALLRAFDLQPAAGQLEWSAPMRQALLERGVDLYREICCALGREATSEHFVRSAQSSGSTWSAAQLEALYPHLNQIPFRVQALPQCSFLHFGSTRQLIPSGITLATQSRELASGMTSLSLNNSVGSGGAIAAIDAWVEGCRISARLDLAGHNVVVGIDVDSPLALPAGAAIDVLSGRGRHSEPLWFIRCYGVDDDFKKPALGGGLFCGRPLLDWITESACTPDDIWDAALPEAERSLWNARVFPATAAPDYRPWLWIYHPATATAEQKAAFRQADRYSAEEVACWPTRTPSTPAGRASAPHRFSPPWARSAAARPASARQTSSLLCATATPPPRWSTPGSNWPATTWAPASPGSTACCPAASCTPSARPSAAWPATTPGRSLPFCPACVSPIRSPAGCPKPLPPCRPVNGPRACRTSPSATCTRPSFRAPSAPARARATPCAPTRPSGAAARRASSSAAAGPTRPPTRSNTAATSPTWPST